MIASLLRRILTALLAIVALEQTAAYTVDGGPYWKDGSVVLQLKLGTTPTYSDKTNPNSTALEAAKAWNSYMGRLQLSGTSSTTGKGNDGNGSNEVFFGSDIYGYAFGSNVLAVTLTSTTATRRTECDVIVNQQFQWDSYRGTLNRSRTDLRRVLAHEFGHVLGLGHPDQAGQYVTALMNAYVSDIAAPQRDDQDGAAYLYGNGTANPAVAPSISSYLPNDVTVAEGQAASFYISLDGAASEPLTYQWRKNAVAIKGAISANFQISAVKSTDAGLYSVVVKNAGGSATSRSALLTVTPATLPAVTVYNTYIPVYLNRSATLYTYIHDGTDPFTYQWEKDGIAIPGATGQHLNLNNVSASDDGSYVLAVSNAAGTVRSDEISVKVLPVPAPAEVSIRADDGSAYQLSVDTWRLNSEFGPYTYQWYRNGQAIAAGTDTSYVIPKVQRNEAADFVVLVANATGVTASIPYTYTPPSTSSSAAQGGWIDARQYGNVIHFLFSNPARIERYDLSQEAWLPSVPLARKPTCFRPDAAGLFVAFGKSISQFNPDGTGEMAVATLPEDVKDLFLRDGILYVFYPQGHTYSQFRSLRLSDKTVIDTKSCIYGMTKVGSLSFAPKLGLIFGRDSGISPADIHVLAVNADGTLGVQDDSPYHGDYDDASRTYVSPDESRIFEDSGTIYTADLSYVGSLGGNFDDLAFTDNGGMLVLRGSTLVAYDSTLVETGRLTVGGSASRLFLRGQTAFLFKPPATSGASITVAQIDLAKLSARTPWPRIDAAGLAYTPSAILLGADNIVYLLSRAHGNVLRWSINEQRYLDSLPLTGAAEFLTYSSTSGKLYVSYRDRRITQLSTSGSEAPFTAMASSILGLSMAGEYLFVNDATSPWTSYYTFDASGLLIARRAWSATSEMFAWNEARHRLYHFRDDTSPNDLLYDEVKTDGTFGTESDSPYHGDIVVQYPICISPNGDNILLGSGIFFDADTLRQDNALPVTIDGAAWLGTQLFTGRTTLDGTQVERWGGSNYGLDASATVPGRLLRMFALPDNKLLVVVMQDSSPTFIVFDSELKTDTPLNLPPSISAIADRTIAKNSSAVTIAFTVTDPETAASALKVRVTSSDVSLVTPGGIILGGTGSERTLKLTPASGLTGSTRISLTVTDGALSSSTTFMLKVQSAPTITTIADQTISEDTTTAAINFSIGDSDTLASDLILSASSSKPGLIDANGISFGGSGVSRTVRLKPAANKNGTATISLVVSDGGVTTTTSFKLTVKPVNDAPTISAIASLQINKNTPTPPISFTIADAETSTTKLSVTTASNNLALVPAENITLGGTGANRMITITPAKNKTGSAMITVTVSDGSLSAKTTLTLTVNSPPTISKIANQRLGMNSATKALAFAIADAETSTTKLTLTKASSNVALVPVKNIVLGGSKGNRTVKVTPSRNKSGSVKITLTVSDGTGSTSMAFWVIIAAAGKGTSITSVAAPVITRELVDQVVKSGDSVTFATGADGGSAGYIWLRDGERIRGVNGPVLTLPSVRLTDAGRYAVARTNALGTVTSETAQLIVVDAASTTMSSSRDVYVVSQTIRVAGDADSLGLSVLLPSGWTYLASANPGKVPDPVDHSMNLLEWIWPKTLNQPITFSYLLKAPAGAALPESFEGMIEVKRADASTKLLLEIPTK